MSKKVEKEVKEMEEMKDENIVPEEEAENQEDETPEETPEEPTKKKFRITKKGAIAISVGLATAVGLIIKGIVTGRSNEEVIDGDLVSEEDLGEPDSVDVSEESSETDED